MTRSTSCSSATRPRRPTRLRPSARSRKSPDLHLAPWQPWFIGQQGNPGRSGQLAAVRLRLPLLLGSGGRHRRLHQHVEPARHQPQGRRPVPQRWRRQRLGRSECRLPAGAGRDGFNLTDPGRYENLTRTISRPRSTPSARRNARSSPASSCRPTSPPSGPGQAQQGFRPKAASIGKAILFPQAVEALGDAGNNLSSEVWWSPSHPFKSSLNGLSAGEVAAAYTQATGKQWTQPIGFVHALFELATDVMGRVSDAGDGDAVAEAIAASNLQTIVGPIAFDGKGLPPFAARNICKTPAGRRPVAAQGRRRL
jgi:branched-chain amino acid transport system substrate-binding protein